MMIKLPFMPRALSTNDFILLIIKRARKELQERNDIVFFDDGSDMAKAAFWLIKQVRSKAVVTEDKSKANLFPSCADCFASNKLKEILKHEPFDSSNLFPTLILRDELKILNKEKGLGGFVSSAEFSIGAMEDKHPGTIFALVNSFHKLETLQKSSSKS